MCFPSSLEVMMPLSPFQSKGSDAPVFLRSPRDAMVYRSVMVFSVFGIAVTFFSLYQMAAGTMKKK